MLKKIHSFLYKMAKCYTESGPNTGTEPEIFIFII